MAQKTGMVNIDHFAATAARRAQSPAYSRGRTPRDHNVVSRDEFFATMRQSAWAPIRREAAYRRLVERHRAIDIAEDLGLSKYSVHQATRQAFALVERYRLSRFCDSRLTGVVDVTAEIEGVIARVNTYIGSVEEGPERTTLRKSVGFLQRAADELRA